MRNDAAAADQQRPISARFFDHLSGGGRHLLGAAHGQ